MSLRARRVKVARRATQWKNAALPPQAAGARGATRPTTTFDHPHIPGQRTHGKSARPTPARPARPAETPPAPGTTCPVPTGGVRWLSEREDRVRSPVRGGIFVAAMSLVWPAPSGRHCGGEDDAAPTELGHSFWGRFYKDAAPTALPPNDQAQRRPPETPGRLVILSF